MDSQSRSGERPGGSHWVAENGVAVAPHPRAVAAAAARTLGNITVVLVLYYVLPLDESFGWVTLAELFGGMVVVAVLATWQVRSVVRSPYPVLRATETLALTVPLFLVLFASSYQVLASTDPDNFSQLLTRTDTLYFVVTVFATVGFGDITPVSELARVLTTVQMIGDLVLVGLVFKAMLSAVRRGRAATPPGDRASPAGRRVNDLSGHDC
jgi:voltage-gated potassium channel